MAAAAVIAVVAIAFAAPLRAMLTYPTWPQDEGTLLEFPSLILKGAVPNQAFLSIYGPANLYAIAGAFLIGGQSVLVERMVAVFYHLILTGSITALVWRRRAIFAGLMAGLVTVVVGESYPVFAFAWVGAIAFVALGLLCLDIGLADTPRPGFVVSSGMCLGLALSFRADLSLPVLVILFVLAATRRRVMRHLVPGLVVGLVPTIVNASEIGFATALRDELYRPVFVIAPQASIPLPSLGSALGVCMALCLVIAFAEIGAGIVGWRRSQGAWDDVCVVLAGVVSLGIVGNMLHRADVTHVEFDASFTFGTALLVDWTRLWGALRGRSDVRGLTRFAWSATVGVVAIAIVTAATSNVFGESSLQSIGARPNPQYLVSNAGRSVPVFNLEEMVSYEAVLRAVDSYARPRERVFVGPEDLSRTLYSDTFLYFLLPRLAPGSFYLEMDPGVADATSSGLAGEIARDDFVILNSLYSSASVGEPHSSTGSDAANLVVDRDFRLVGQWGSISLYARRAVPRP